MKKVIFVGWISLMAVLLGFSPEMGSNRGQAVNDVVKVYGPGGPLGPIKEVAEQFTKETGIKVEVTAGPEEKWIDQAKQDADIIYGGSEYMLTEFMHDHPEVLNEKTVQNCIHGQLEFWLEKETQRIYSHWRI